MTDYRSLFSRSIRDYLDMPYDFRESMGWLWRNIRGINVTNPCHVVPLSSKTIIHAIQPRIRVGFIGDVMDLYGKALHIAPEVREFVKSCDSLIGNMEATVTHIRRPRPSVQRLSPSILDALASFFPAEKTFFSVANNHAGDFEPPVFRSSIQMMKSFEFNVFGHLQSPFAVIADNIRVVGATMWYNRTGSDVTALSDARRSAAPAHFNILYPHWGYELELFPRSDMISAGQDLLRQFDMVIGHHPHVPQPLTAMGEGGMKKLLAFSLGDFCTGLPFKKYHAGIVCRIDIGTDTDGVMKIGTVEWRCTRSRPDRAGVVHVEFTEPVF